MTIWPFRRLTQSRSFRQFRVLHREFLFRIVDRELLSPHATGDASQLLLQFASLLIFVSLVFLLPLQYMSAAPNPQMRLTIAWSMEHFLIATTMLVVGLFAVLSWDNMFPDRRDVFVLAPLPIRARTVFLAKIAAVTTALSLTALSLHAATGLVWPLVLNREATPLTVPARTSDPASPPVGAAGLRAVMDQDLARVLRDGPLAPGAGGGIAIGVYARGARQAFAYGAATTASLFEIGSITKPFTGLVLAQMVEEGTVRLDQPVRELLPQVEIARPEGVAEITLLDLATHRSGLPGIPANFQPRDRGAKAVTQALAEYDAKKLHAYLASRGVNKPAQGNFRYSNLGFGLLGHALAVRAGTDYPTLVREMITAPLGMTDTVVVPSPDRRRRFLQGYSGERQPVPTYDLDAFAGAGGLRSTAPDMLRWLEANLHPERLPAGTLRTALASSHRVRPTTWTGPRMALAWFVSEAGIFTHGGATAGYTADAFFNPRTDTAFIVLSNTGPGSVVSADILSQHIRARLEGTSPVAIAEVVIPASGGGWIAQLRTYAAYWVTMLAAGIFMFGLVMGVQGAAAQLLPRRYFLRVSSYLQLGAFATIVSVFCLQPMQAGPATLVEVQRHGLLAWLPSFWFVGLFQWLNGSPALASLAQRAWVGLGLAIVATTAAYTLSYFRTLRKIAEEPDIVPGAVGLRWLPPFGNRPQTAIVQFSIRTLLRSAQHRVIVAFYLGLGFAGAIFFLKLPRPDASAATAAEAWIETSLPLILASVIMLAFAVVGTRMAFALPRDLRANWIFRITPLQGGLPYLAARRRALFAVAIVPVVTPWAALLLWSWPWQPALGHVAVLGLLGLTLAELGLRGVQKIPFTCAYLPGKSTIHATFWVAWLFIVPLTFAGAQRERDALQHLPGFAAMVAALALAWVGIRWGVGWLSPIDATRPAFDEERPGRIETLDLWDVRFAPASMDRIPTPETRGAPRP